MVFVCTGGEMADTLALGASAARHGGSSPLPCTVRKRRKGVFLCTGEDLKDGSYFCSNKNN